MRRVAPPVRGQPAALARGEPDGMTSSAAPAWNAAVGEGAGCLDHLPSGPPHFPLSAPASTRGQTFRHIAPSPFLPFLSQGRKEPRLPSTRPLLPQPALPSNSLPHSSRREHCKTTRKLGASRRRSRGQRSGPACCHPGRRWQAGPPPPLLEPSGGAKSPRRRDPPAGVHAHPGLDDPRASSQLPSLREPQELGAKGGRVGSASRRAARASGWAGLRRPGRGLRGLAPGAGAGCGPAPSSRLSPPVCGRGRAPVPGTDHAAPSGGGESWRGSGRDVRSGFCLLPGAGGAGERAGCRGEVTRSSDPKPSSTVSLRGLGTP